MKTDKQVLITSLERRLTDSDKQLCEESAELCRFYEGSSFESNYIIALKMKLQRILNPYERKE